MQPPSCVFPEILDSSGLGIHIRTTDTSRYLERPTRYETCVLRRTLLFLWFLPEAMELLVSARVLPDQPTSSFSA